MILLSFDIEEFDVPKEKGLDISLEDSIKVSIIGTNKILDILKKNDVCATLFCTANFAENAKDVIERAISEGHEIACHGVDHWKPRHDDPKVSKETIESLYDVKIKGYRQPRMFDVSDKIIKKSDYKYNSSLNPAFIPGKYIHLNIPRTIFVKNGIVQVPASVSTHLRIPLFWLSLHNFPLKTYEKLALGVYKLDGYFTTYFHPWEFVNHPDDIKKYLLPIVNRNIGDSMCYRLDHLIKFFKSNNCKFTTYYDYLCLRNIC